MVLLKNQNLKSNAIASVDYRRSDRAKYLRITLQPDRSVVITVPRRCTTEQARKFLESKFGWIRKHLHKLQQQQQALAKIDCTPDDLNKVQSELFNRLDEFSGRFDLPYNRAGFRCQKTRWGSCSDKNNINLNINMAFLPAHLQDYILLHELTHIKIKNHSKDFWSLLDRFCNGRAKALARELRSYPMPLRNH